MPVYSNICYAVFAPMRFCSLLLYLLLIGISINGFAQSIAPASQNLVTLSGKIIHAQNILISIDILDNPISQKLNSYASRIDSSGNFIIQLPLSAPTLTWLFHANQSVPLYLHPADNFTATMHGQDITNTLQLKGTGSDNCRLTAEYHRQFNRATQRSMITQKMNELEPDAFINYANDLKQQKQQLLQDYLAKGNITQNCQQFVQAQIAAEWAAMLMDFPTAYSFKLNELTPSNLPPNYYSFMDNVNLQNPDIMHLSVFTDYLQKYLSFKLNRAQKRNPQPNPDTYYADKYEFAKTILSGKALFFVQGMCIADACTYSKAELIASKFDDYLIACPYPDYNAAVAQIYDKAYRTSAGQPAPIFTLLNLNGDTVSLTQLKGKVVYLDFWATWCAPCVREFPYAEQLKKQFANQNVAFVYIAVDDNPMAWEEFLRTKKPTTDTLLHLFAQSADMNLQDLYNVKGVPRYLIIDAQGIIADSNAKRPSDAGLAADILKILKRTDPQNQN